MAVPPREPPLSTAIAHGSPATCAPSLDSARPWQSRHVSLPCPPHRSPPISFALAVGLSPDGVKLFFLVIFAVGRSPDGDKQKTNCAKASSSVGLRWLTLQRGLTGRWTTGLGSVDTSASV